MERCRPYYDQSLKALSEAHKVLYDYEPKDILAMSHGPFSGVNKVLGIVDLLEETCQILYTENIELKERLKMTDTNINTITLPLSDEDAKKLAQLPVDAPEKAPMVDYPELKELQQ